MLPSSDLVKDKPRGSPAKSKNDPTILVVDDYDSVLRVMTSILTYAGYRVISFKRARAALKYLRDGGKADLVISDVIMPAMGGCRLAVSIRRHSPGTSILLVTAHTSESIEVHLQCGRACTLDVLQKPFHLHQLLGKVGHLIDSKACKCQCEALCWTRDLGHRELKGDDSLHRANAMPVRCR